MTQHYTFSRFLLRRRCRVFVFLGIFHCLIHHEAPAQQSIYTHVYRQNWQLVNPAAKVRWQHFPHGKHQTYTIAAGTRRSWLGNGIDSKSLPVTSQISIEWEPNTGNRFQKESFDKVGGVLLHDRTDAIQHTQFMLNYARMLPLDLAEEHLLFLGMNLGGAIYSVNAQRLLAWDDNDPTILEATTGTRTLPEVAFGVFYRNESGFYAGVSLPKLVSMWQHRTADPGTGQSSFSVLRSPLSHYYVVVGNYFSPFGEENVFFIEPALWLRGSRGVSFLNFSNQWYFPFSVDVSCRAVWHRMFGVGLGFSTMQQLIFDFSFEKKLRHLENLQAENQDCIRIGLNYGLPLGWNTTALGHSIELNLSYAFWGF